MTDNPKWLRVADQEFYSVKFTPTIAPNFSELIPTLPNVKVLGTVPSIENYASKVDFCIISFTEKAQSIVPNIIPASTFNDKTIKLPRGPRGGNWENIFHTRFLNFTKYINIQYALVLLDFLLRYTKQDQI